MLLHKEKDRNRGISQNVLNQHPSDEPMSLSTKKKRILWVSAELWLVVLNRAGRLLYMDKIFSGREGSLRERGGNTSNTVRSERREIAAFPYYLWLVLPRVFSRPHAWTRWLQIAWRGLGEGHEFRSAFQKRWSVFARNHQ